MARKSTPTSDAQNTPGGTWLTGQALIAMPSLAGSTFARSVIYMCAHTADGAMGIVLNQPLASPSFEGLLKTLGVAPLPRRAASGCIPAARSTTAAASSCTPPTGPATAACGWTNAWR